MSARSSTAASHQGAFTMLWLQFWLTLSLLMKYQLIEAYTGPRLTDAGASAGVSHKLTQDLLLWDRFCPGPNPDRVKLDRWRPLVGMPWSCFSSHFCVVFF